MRGSDQEQVELFSYISLEDRIPERHPLRPLRKIVNEVLKDMSGDFGKIYSNVGRPSISPEKLLRSLFIQVLYSIRSERMLVEQLNFNLLFRWFVGLSVDDAVWHQTTFTKNRDRLLEGGIADKFFARVVAEAGKRRLLSNEHFTVDGTLIEAWASLKSFKPKESEEDRDKDDPDDKSNPTVNFHGEKRCNQSHESTTDPEARLYRKSMGKEAKLYFSGHVLMDNRHGIAVSNRLGQADSRAEWDAALDMIKDIPGNHRVTLGADKGYDTREMVEGLRAASVTPHIAAKKAGYSAIDARTTRHISYVVSQRKRKKVEEIFGWAKTVGLLRKTRHRGKNRVRWMFTFTLAVYNLVRIRNLTWEGAK